EVSPLATVRSAMLTVGLPASPKTRLTWLPLTVRLLTPGPLIVRLSVMSSSLVRAMVPVVAKLITSAPGLALAAVTAARSAAGREPGPVFRRLVTVKVDGRLRSSIVSKSGRTRQRRRSRHARRLCRAELGERRPNRAAKRERNHMGCLLCEHGLLYNGNGD